MADRCMIPSITIIVLTDEERDALRAHRGNAPHKLMRRMAEAILMLSRGASRRFVADFVGRSVGTVGRWVGKWRRSGLDSIRTGHAGNRNACLLTGEQEEEVLKALSRPPSEQGLDAEFWSVPDLAGWIHGRFSVRRASDAYYRCLLHMAGLSFHLPESVDRRRAPEEEIEARMAQIRDEIAEITGEKADGEKAVREDVIVVSADEVGIEHEAILRRAWYAKNTKVKLRVDRERKSQKYIGFLHESDGSVDLMRLERGDTENIVKALIKLTLKYPGKRIVVVWDNASYSGHFTKSFCEAVWEFVAPNEGLECVAGVLEVGALSVADGFLALPPDAFDGVLVRAVGRHVDQVDPLQGVPLPQVLPQLLRLVPSGVVPHHDYPLAGVSGRH